MVFQVGHYVKMGNSHSMQIRVGAPRPPARIDGGSSLVARYGNDRKGNAAVQQSRLVPSAPFAYLPHFFARPFPGPLESQVRISCGRSLQRPHLDQIFDFETRASEQPNPVAVRQMELDA